MYRLGTGTLAGFNYVSRPMNSRLFLSKASEREVRVSWLGSFISKDSEEDLKDVHAGRNLSAPKSAYLALSLQKDGRTTHARTLLLDLP